MKKRYIPALILATIFCLLLCACGKEPAPPASDKTVVAEAEAESLREQAKATGCEIFDGVYVTELFSYSGVFPEDGGSGEVDRVAAARVVNLSPVDYKYIEFTLYSGNRNYTFFVSTLLSGAKLTVLESAAAPCKTPEPIRTSKVTAIEAFDEKPSVYLDTFRIVYGDGLLSVENKSKRDVKNAAVYYKTVNDDGYFGGITYKVDVGDLPAKEKAEVRLADGSLTQNNTRIVFVTYEN